MKKVLIIAYSFPPKPSVSSLRSGGLAKYLPEYGWELIVLTPVVPEGSPIDVKIRQIRTQDHDVIASWRKRLRLNPDKYVSIQQQLGIVSNNSFKVINWFIRLSRDFIAYPDRWKGWYPFAIKAAEEFLQKEHLDALISSSPPVTSHLVAKHLKTKFSIPWVADIRDLWSQNHYHSYSFLQKIVTKRLEKKTLSLADVLVTVSKPWTEELHQLHGEKPLWSIPNGFDPEELVKFPVQLTEKFTITYTGILYGGKRDPSLLLEVLKELIIKEYIDPNDIQIRFYGPEKLWLENKIDLYGLRNVAKHYGRVLRETVLKRQRESQILLLLNWDTPDPGEKGMCPAKLFEYLAAQRPILAIGGPPGAVTDILKETRSGVHIFNPEDLRQVLLKYYQEYKERGRVDYMGGKDKVMKYSHKEMARKFAHILSAVGQNSVLKT